MAQIDGSGIRTLHADRLTIVLRLLVCALILKVTAVVVLNYRDYLPPDFNSEFLRGRETYFYGGYQWAFFAHIAVGPCVLVLGMIQLSERFRRWSAQCHRNLGKALIACILLVMTPSSLWMARYAETGVLAGLSFALLAVATASTAWFGWRSAVLRQFAAHRLWMVRCYVLLCSAVFLRLMSGFATAVGLPGDWTYPVAAWVSWVAPLATLEAMRWRNRNPGVQARPIRG